MAADGASLRLGLALRRLGDRSRLLSFLVARLREKVPPDLLMGCSWVGSVGAPESD